MKFMFPKKTFPQSGGAGVPVTAGVGDEVGAGVGEGPGVSVNEGVALNAGGVGINTVGKMDVAMGIGGQ